MAHPICGADLRKGTKVVAFVDSILSALTIFTALIVLNTFFNGVVNPDLASFSIGGVILLIVLLAINIFLDFRLYRSAHERNLDRIKQYRETALIVLTLSSVLALFVRHTANNSDLNARYPLLWFYVLCLLAAVFRVYMYLVVKAFLEEFQLP